MAQNIVPSHMKNTKKLSTLDDIKLNPFLWHYLANYYLGESDSLSLATVAILPRVLGTSITTTFGKQMQKLIVAVLDNVSGSNIPGIDIEYVDAIDGRKKYCQVKSGPQALNKDDVKTIKDHFKGARNRGMQNSLPTQEDDWVFAMIYGEPSEYNAFVRELSDEYVVYCGEDFWYRLTGDRDFYLDLAKAMAEVAIPEDSKEIVKETIKKLAIDIESKYPELDGRAE